LLSIQPRLCTVFALDSTSISLSLALFLWAPGKYSRGAVKVHAPLDLRENILSFILVSDGKCHESNVLDLLVPVPGAVYLLDKAYVDFEALYRMDTAGAFFGSRGESNMDYSVVEQNFNIDPASGLRTDRTVTLNGHRSKKLYPGPLRLVEYHDQESDVDLLFLTNNMEVSALEVAKLYCNKWQIETFFKWIKQNLAIKKLWGQSENAINIHIWAAICTYLVVARKTFLKNRAVHL